MPQPFNSAVITNAGARILTRAQAGEEIKIEFTRIAVGDGIYTETEKTLEALQKQTDLKSFKNSYTLSSIDVFSDNSVKVTALITNQDPVTGKTLVSTGYYINEMGLFAKVKDGEESIEFLYSITTTAGDNGDFMPAYNGYNPAQITQEYFVTVNSSEVTIVSTGAALLVEDANKMLHTLKDEMAENLGEKLDKTGNASNVTVEFEQASKRENISTGGKLSDFFGQIAKWLADLKNVAFTGNYNDLTNKPTIPAAVRVKGNAESTYRAGDVNITPENLGLDNTKDINKPVSTAQQAAIDAAYANANEFTLQKIAELVNGAPETLDTLKEVADAIAEHKSVTDALDAAIGRKANQTELDSHTGNQTVHITESERNSWNDKQSKTGDTKSNIVTFAQASKRENISSGDSHATIFGKVAKYFSDLKEVAFSGKYSDLSGAPDSLPANGGTSASCSGNAATATTAAKVKNALTFTGGATGSYDGSAAKSVAIPNGSAADKNYTTSVKSGSTDLVTSGGVHAAIHAGTALTLNIDSQKCTDQGTVPRAFGPITVISLNLRTVMSFASTSQDYYLGKITQEEARPKHKEYCKIITTYYGVRVLLKVLLNGEIRITQLSGTMNSGDSIVADINYTNNSATL